MKTFKMTAAQGELSIRRIGNLPANRAVPAGYTPLAIEDGKLIVGHSETGHHHCFAPDSVSVAVMDRAPEGMRILRAIVESPTSLVHLRDHDTHESIMFEPGEYEIRVTREFDPYEQLARQQAD